MTKTLGVGIIGCGNISTTYLTLAPLFKGIEIRAVADLERRQFFGVSLAAGQQLERPAGGVDQPFNEGGILVLTCESSGGTVFSRLVLKNSL